MYVCMCVCVCVCMHTCIYTYECMFLCAYMYAVACVHVYIYICMCVVNFGPCQWPGQLFCSAAYVSILGGRTNLKCRGCDDRIAVERLVMKGFLLQGVFEGFASACRVGNTRVNFTKIENLNLFLSEVTYLNWLVCTRLNCCNYCIKGSKLQPNGR
jgi:hypothetical protein